VEKGAGALAAAGAGDDDDSKSTKSGSQALCRTTPPFQSFLAVLLGVIIIITHGTKSEGVPIW